MPPTRESKYRWDNELAGTLLGALAITAAMQPGVLVGALPSRLWWRWRKPPLWLRIASALVPSAAAIAAAAAIVWAWPWRLALVHVGGHGLWHSAWTSIPSPLGASIAIEALAGSAWLFGWNWAMSMQERSPGWRIEQERQAQERRRTALNKAGAAPSTDRVAGTDHPPGNLRLGVAVEGEGKPFDLGLPPALAQHVTVLGKIGTGKTTTAARIIDGAVANGWPVVIVDAKGFGALRSAATQLADRAGVPFCLVAPDDPMSFRYNPCTGSPSQVSNKLVGAFHFGDDAEIYKQIAQEAVSVLVRARQATGKPVTLAWLHGALNPQKMNGLAVSLGDGHQALRELVVDLANRGNLFTTAYAGMRARLGALLQGEYGPVFDVDDDLAQLDLADVFAVPAITYFSLPVLGSPEDVILMAAVLAQDIKQVAARRIGEGDQSPALLVLDEFAGLGDASQLQDLLLQAREARIAAVVCTQFLPHKDQAPELRHALLSAGVFCAHQPSADDVDAIAGLFGTKDTIEATQQMDYRTGYSEKGTFKTVKAFRVEPDHIRDLPRGVVAVRVEPEEHRIALVKVYPPNLGP